MSKHESCPSCPSSDAFWRYEDGHGYCFSCHSFFPANKTIRQLAETLEKTDQASHAGSAVPTTVIDTSSFTHSIRADALAWLFKYGITAQEIKEHSIMWDTDRESLVFPVFSSGSLKVTNSRYFGKDPKHPKYITRGKKNNYFKLIENVASPYMIIVEDYISCIKAGRKFSSMCLFGSSLSTSQRWINMFEKMYKKVYIYLDPDKKLESLNIAMKLQQLGINAEPMYSMNDPKTDL